MQRTSNQEAAVGQHLVPLQEGARGWKIQEVCAYCDILFSFYYFILFFILFVQNT